MVEILKKEYNGWPNAYKITNGRVDIIALSDVGPRIIWYGFSGEENQFVELPEHLGLIGGDEWRIYGGHRLWHSPEDLNRTYFPDNHAVKVITKKNGIILIQQVEPTTKIQKSLEIEMDCITGSVTVVHRIRNCGLWDIKLSAWAISAMAPGGLSIMKLRKHSYINRCVPNIRISVWPESSINDKRLSFNNDYILLKQDTGISKSFKIGISSDVGWVAYANNNNLFVKYYDYKRDVQYPDFGCTVELYTCREFSEVETLSPLTKLSPGDEVNHKEIWQLFKTNKTIDNLLEEGVLDKFLEPLNSGFNR